MSLTPQQLTTLLDLARASIRASLAHQPPPTLPANLDPPLLEPSGCFVSLHESASHRLRGCIGHLQSNEPLAQTVLNAAAAVLDDPRFTHYRVTTAELPHIDIELSILSPMQPARDPMDFEPHEHGLYLIVGPRSGCFLPQVARETGWTKEQLLTRLCTEKMGLPATAWKEPGARLLRFAVTIAGPEPFEVRSASTRPPPMD